MATNPFLQYVPSGDRVIAPAPPSEQRAARDQQLQEQTSLLQNQLAELTIAEKQRKAAEDAEKLKATASADTNARDKLLGVLNAMNKVALDANDNSGWGETGWLGARMRGWEGYPAFDLGKDIDTVRANFAFDALQAMRDASKTGGALGAITERELELLEAATSNIDPNRSHNEFLEAVETARQMYLSKLVQVDRETAMQMGYDPEKALQSYLKTNDAYNKQFGSQKGARSLKFDVEPQTPQAGWGKAQVVK
jgi:hypothetical protein